MTVFEFIFSLYSLLFGLALAQVFAGFGNTLQERHKIKVGWLTPLLGLFVILDLTSFWEIAWELRWIGAGRPYFLYLICAVTLAGIYYLAARLVFPRNFVEWPDFDVYYLRHKQWVFGGILFCNVIASGVMLTGSDFLHFVQSPLGFLNSRYLFHFADRVARGEEQASQHRAPAFDVGEIRGLSPVGISFGRIASPLTRAASSQGLNWEKRG